MGIRYAKGSRAWGICQRCGQRDLLAALLFDDQYPNLRVHAYGCWDPKHPQERLLPVSDPSALWRPSPEEYPIVAPILVATQIPASNIELDWSSATSHVLRIDGYRLYRRVNDEEEWTLVDTFLNVYDDYAGLLSETLAFEDTDTYASDDVVHYYVEAFSGEFGANSNEETIVWAGYSVTAPVLTAIQPPGADVNLTWTAAISNDPASPVDGYEIYVSLNGAAATLLTTVDDLVLSYDDATSYANGDVVLYYIIATTTGALSAQSNNASVTFVAVPAGMNIPLVFNQDDFAGLVTMTRLGYKSITPDGFACNGYDNRLSSTSIPANLQSATAELGFQVSMYHFGGEVRATSREVVACLGLNDSNSTPKAEIFVDADASDSADPRVGFATRVAGVRTEFRLNRSRWQFQWRRHETTNAGSQAYVQGCEYNPVTGNMIYSVHFNDTLTRVYEVDLETGAMLRYFDLPSPYVHVGAIARRGNEEWWFCDYATNTLLRISLEASFVSGSAVIDQTITVSALGSGTGYGLSGICIGTVGGTEYLFLTIYVSSGTPYVVVFPATVLAGTTLALAARYRRYQAYFRSQGIYLHTDGCLYMSFGTGNFSAGRIIRVQATTLLAALEGAALSTVEDTNRYLTPPTNFPEDLTVDPDGWLWTGTESDITFQDDLNFNCLWRAKLYEQSTDTQQVYFKGFPLNTYTCNYDGAGTWNILMNGRLFREFTAVPDAVPAMITIGGPIQASAGGLNGFFRGLISGLHAGPAQVTAEQIPIFAGGGYETRSLTVYSFPAFNWSFEADVVGWTNETGVISRRQTNPTPYDSSDVGFGFGGTTVQCISRQRFATSALLDGSGNAMPNARLDAGNIWFVNSFLTASFTNHGDSCSVGWRFLNSSQVQLSLDQGEIYSPLPDLIWKYRANNAQTPPSGTRFVDLLYRSDRTDGTNNDGYVDKIRAYAFMEP